MATTDLGIKPPQAAPEEPMSATSDEPMYPCAYVSDVDLSDLPETGVMKVKYRLRRSYVDHKSGKNSYDIELMQILDSEPVEAESEDEAEVKVSRGEHLDKMLDEAEETE